MLELELYLETVHSSLIFTVLGTFCAQKTMLTLHKDYRFTGCVPQFHSASCFK